MVLAPMFVFLVGWFVIGRLIPLAFKDEPEKDEAESSGDTEQDNTTQKQDSGKQ
ncbi:hypothetical protein [Motiliproteus sp.]|uniref:hypothetical protein n=1 Tax=Motiliproteus sp. TaxID=1898955 RepID=UPI003BA9B921